MTTSAIWARIDVDLPTHPDCLDAGEDATNLFVRGILYCRKHLTDGRLPKAALGVLSQKPDAAVHAAELVRVGLWVDEGSAWVVRDFLQRNPSREEVVGKREAAAERKRRWKERNANGTRSERVSGNVQEQEQEQEQEQRLDPPCSPPAGAGGESETGPKRRPPPATTFAQLQRAWNERAHDAMPRCRAQPKLSGPMKSELRTRPLDGPTGWLALIDRMNASSWCRGEAPTSTRAMDVSFLLRHPADLLNGKYDDRTPPKPNTKPETDWERRAREKYGSA